MPAAVCRWGLCPRCPGVGRCLSFQQNTGHTHSTRTTTQPNTQTKHTTEPLSSDRRLRDDGACHLPRLGGWPRRSQHGKQGRSPTRPGALGSGAPRPAHRALASLRRSLGGIHLIIIGRIVFLPAQPQTFLRKLPAVVEEKKSG